MKVEKFEDLEYMLNNNWLQVWKTDKTDGITWDQLQKVKNVVFGDEVTAIEIYPAVSQLVNLKNVRHLWVLSNKTSLPNLKKFLFPKDKQEEV